MLSFKPFIAIICLLTGMASCENKTQNNNATTRSLPQETSTAPLDTAIKTLPATSEPKKKNEYKSVFPKGTWKTYPQICRSLFGKGSTKDEVTHIMGSPELVEYPKDGYETWFYGKVEITFKYTFVDDVYREDLCPKYVYILDLLTSDDPIERRFGAKLMDGFSH